MCGNCQHEFPLSNMAAFIQHKKFDCDDSLSAKGNDVNRVVKFDVSCFTVNPLM